MSASGQSLLCQSQLADDLRCRERSFSDKNYFVSAPSSGYSDSSFDWIPYFWHHYYYCSQRPQMYFFLISCCCLIDLTNFWYALRTCLGWQDYARHLPEKERCRWQPSWAAPQPYYSFSAKSSKISIHFHLLPCYLAPWFHQVRPQFWFGKFPRCFFLDFMLKFGESRSLLTPRPGFVVQWPGPSPETLTICCSEVRPQSPFFSVVSQISTTGITSQQPLHPASSKWTFNFLLSGFQGHYMPLGDRLWLHSRLFLFSSLPHSSLPTCSWFLPYLGRLTSLRPHSTSAPTPDPSSHSSHYASSVLFCFIKIKLYKI